MPKLNENQMRLRIEREKKKNEAIQKKMEIQKKKEIYGEAWRQNEQTHLQKELELEIGSEKAPKIYDSVDLYKFFDPIQMYKDEENKVLKMDLKQFKESEKEYSKALAELDKELDKIKNEEKDTNTETQQESTSSNEEILKEDGAAAEDDLVPIEAEAGDELEKMKKETPAAIAKGKLHRIASTYLNRFVPMYNKHVCTCCGMPKNVNDYYIVYNLSCVDRIDEKGNAHLWICKECVQKLFMYYYSILCKHNVELSMQYLCASLNLYWDMDLLAIARKKFDDSGRKGTLVGAYIKEINSGAPGLCFMDSPFLTDEHYNAEHRTISASDETPIDWSPEDLQNKKDVIRIVGYDPFETVKDETVRKTLYKDFCSLIDEELAQDYVKCQSALTIVRSFLKVRQLDEKMALMEENHAPLTEQKAVSDLKKKELDSITSFCASNGWSERFKSKVAKGETSFTGIMKAMNEKKFENAIANKFDIQTGATMQQAADISVNAIMKQLSFSEAEVWKITQDQYAELVKLRRQISTLEEDLRKSRYETAELKMLAQAKKVEDE